MTFAEKYSLYFLVLWSVCYLLYPSWLWPVSAPLRFWVLVGMLLFLYGLSRFVRHGFHAVPPPCEREDECRGIGRLEGGIAILVLAVWLSLQRPWLFLPIAAGDDEGFHLCSGVLMLGEINQFVPIGILQKELLIAAAVGILFLLFHRKGGWLGRHGVRLWWMITLTSVALGFFFLRDIVTPEVLFRYPPMARLGYAIMILLGGQQEWLLRLFPIAFSLGTSFFLYRMLLLFSAKESAFFGALLYLFLPGVFHFAHSGQLEAGTGFFLSAASFYFLRAVQRNSQQDLVRTVWWFAAGFLYKQFLLVAFLWWVPFLLVNKMVGKKDPHLGWSFLARCLVIGFLSCLPWLLVGYLFSFRNYRPTLSHWSNFDLMLGYLNQTMKLSHWAILLIACLGGAYAVWKNRVLAIYGIFWFVGFLVFFVSDQWGGRFGGRDVFYVLPAISLFAGMGFEFLRKVLSSFGTRILFISCFILLVMNVASLNKTLRSRGIPLFWFPYPDAIRYLIGEAPKASHILTWYENGDASFYERKYRNDFQWYRLHPFFLQQEEALTSIVQRCIEDKIDYLLIPFSQGSLETHLYGSHTVHHQLSGGMPGYRLLRRFVFRGDGIAVYQVERQRL